MRTGYNASNSTYVFHSMAEGHMMNCYDDDGSYYRSEPSNAEEIYNSNWEAGHMGQSFSPTCHYLFSDGSVVEVGYSGAWVIPD